MQKFDGRRLGFSSEKRELMTHPSSVLSARHRYGDIACHAPAIGCPDPVHDDKEGLRYWRLPGIRHRNLEWRVDFGDVSGEADNFLLCVIWLHVERASIKIGEVLQHNIPSPKSRPIAFLRCRRLSDKKSRTRIPKKHLDCGNVVLVFSVD